MYYKNQTKLINNKILTKLIEISNWSLTNEHNPIIFIDKISCSLSATEISSYASNEIEGIRLDIINQSKEVNNESTKYINNYNEILNYIKENIDYINLSPNELLGWHKKLFENTIKQYSIGGKYKIVPNRVIDNNNVLFEGASLFDTPILMEELINWYKQSDLPPLIKIIVFNADFLMIHPYNDGNGRMSRLIMNYMLLKEGFELFKYTSLEETILKHKDDYLRKLKTININWNFNNSDYSQLIEWFLDIFIITKNSLYSKYNLINLFKEKAINKSQLIVAIIDFIQHNNQKICRENIRQFLLNFQVDISEILIKKVLLFLTKNQFLILITKGNSSTYKINDQKWEINNIYTLLKQPKET